MAQIRTLAIQTIASQPMMPSFFVAAFSTTTSPSTGGMSRTSVCAPAGTAVVFDGDTVAEESGAQD